MGCNFEWTITGALTEVTFGKSLRERRGCSLAPGERVPQREGDRAVSAKALRWKAWSACSGTVRRPVGLRAGVTERVAGTWPEARGRWAM